MKSIWFIAIIIILFVVYAYVGFGGEGIISNSSSPRNGGEGTGANATSYSTVNIKAATLPTPKAVITESKTILPKNKAK